MTTRTIVQFGEDEWYPVYSVDTEVDAADLLTDDSDGLYVVDDTVLKRWADAAKVFDDMQNEIRALIKQREDIRCERIRQERANEDAVLYDPISGRSFNSIARDTRIQSEQLALAVAAARKRAELIAVNSRREAFDE